MSKSQSKISSATRSLGTITPRRHRARRTLSVASPAKSDASGRLSSVVEKFINNDKFTISPMKRRSVLPDDTEIEAPRRASWWKRLEGSSRDVLEALDTNKMPDDLLMEEYEFEVEKDKQNHTAPQSSDNESVASIVVPQRRLFTQKKQSQAKFGDIVGSRKSLGRTNIEDESIDDAPKNLFNKGPRNRPVFPAALLNSTNKTINKTVEPETNKQARPNLFGQAGTKRKNMFTDFVLSESEEDSEVQHKVFGFKNKRMSLGTRNRRMPSLTPSVTTEIDIDDWNLLPSSTMIGAPEVSRIITDKDIELAQEENQDNTLTEENASLNPETDQVNKTKSIRNKSLHPTKLTKSIKDIDDDDDNNKTLTNENIEKEDSSKCENIKEFNVSKEINNTHNYSKSARFEDKSLQNKSLKRSDNTEEIIENMAVDQVQGNVTNHRLIDNGPSIEDVMAELHGEIKEKETSQQNTQNQGNLTFSEEANNSNKDEDMKNMHQKDTCEKVVPSPKEHESQNKSTQARKTNQDEQVGEISNQDKNEKKRELSTGEQENEGISKEESQENQDENMDDTSEKEKSEEEIEPSLEEQEIQDSSKEESQENQDEDVSDTSEKDKSDEEIEPSSEDPENLNSSKESSNEIRDEDMDDTSDKDKSDEEIEPSSEHPENLNSSKESSNENQEDMEELVWDNNDDEKSDVHVETEEKGKLEQEKSGVSIRVNSSKNVSNKSQKILGFPVREDQIEQENDVIEDTPNSSTHDTTGRNRKEEISQVKSPEAVLQNITKDNESFRPIGRSTTFRKSKSIIFDNMNIRSSLPPVQESTLGSEGSRNSSTEGSGWDSHRTTRKTIRQTFGKDFTPRKSLRALVMEQSAKRQTELYNKTTANVTKNKTVVEDVNDKNASKINKTKNKIVLDDVDERNASKMNKTKNKKELEDAYERNAAVINKTKNKTVLEDVNDHHIRDRRVSNRNLSSNPLSDSISPAHETLTHHVSDPLISEPRVSYHRSLRDVNEPETSEQQISNGDASINISELANNDSGPEISIHASYGQGMSAEHSDRENTDEDENISMAHDPSDLEISDKEKRRNDETTKRNFSVRMKSMHVTSEEEMLDYEASDHEQTEEDISEPEEVDREHSSQENAEQNDSVQELSEHSSIQEEKDDSGPEESENEVEAEESENEVEQLEEEYQEEEPESELEVSQQEEPESEQEESQQEIDAESEQESENEDHDMSHESVHDASQHESEQESAHNISEDLEIVSDQDENDPDDSENLVSQLNSQYQMSNSNRTERVVFDNEMSDQEIDYELSERVSRQLTDIDISEQESEREPTPELTRSRVSEPSRTPDVSIGTKKSMLLMQMEKIAQQNMEIRQKIREKVQNSLKTTRNVNNMSPIQAKFSIRRVNKEPKKARSKPKPTGVPATELPREFVQDLLYKPPKRFQPPSAPWITKRLYKFLETKLEPKYDYRARVRAEELVQTLHSFAKLVRRRDLAPPAAVDELKREMARLHVVNTHFEFYDFFHEFMPREIRIKVNPDVVNKIPMPRNGVFAEILLSRSAVA